MVGTNRIVMCPAQLKEALATYLNEHVLTPEHHVKVGALEWTRLPGDMGDEKSLQLALENKAAKPEISGS